MRIFHYTIMEHYEEIARDRHIRVATLHVPLGERPAVWFSVHPLWEPTATVALGSPGEVHRATWAEMQALGPVRIEVAPETAPYRWRDYLRLSGVSPATARGLERSARARGANPFHWRVAFDSIPMEKWLGVELWTGSGWDPIQARLMLEDPRFAFIAKTEEEWTRFRQAAIVVVPDAQTGKFSVVFGREQIETKEDGEERVRVLVVPIDPATDELDRLAAACLVLKGRHDLLR